MTAAERIGQLFMGAARVPTTSAAGLTVLRRYDVGSVILTGRSHVGVWRTRALADRLQSLGRTTKAGRAGLLVAVDQEGGQVQVLSGPGFSAIPAALEQGQWSVARLRERAEQWAAQLRSAGVNVDLAPVGDVVPARIGTANGPIGRYGRQFGATPDVVSRQGAAFVEGFSRSGVLTTLKHFPGLGRVSGNTDTTEQVTDTTLTRDSADVASFRSGIESGAGLVMVSLATYALIDPAHKAVFSPTVLTGMLRHDLGFQGVIVSDDLGKAAAVRSVSPAQRAVSFLRAGGDLVLTVNNAVLPAMVEAVSHTARHDAAFKARTDASVRRVLKAKEAAGVLRCG
jgi:beta-N-acetylhexosaminidase